MKVTTVVSKATRLTCEICSGVLSDIGAKIKAPNNGIRISAVSIIIIFILPSILNYRFSFILLVLFVLYCPLSPPLL